MRGVPTPRWDAHVAPVLDDLPSECKGSSHTFSPALEPVKTKLADVLVGSTVFAESIEPLRAEMGYAASMASFWFPSADQSADQGAEVGG